MPMQLKIKSWLGKTLSKAFYGEAQISLCLWDDPAPSSQHTHMHRHTRNTNSQSPRNTGFFINAQPLQTVLFQFSIPFLMPGKIHLGPQDSPEISFLPSSLLPLPLIENSSVPLVQLQCPVHTSPFILTCYEIIYFLLICLNWTIMPGR